MERIGFRYSQTDYGLLQEENKGLKEQLNNAKRIIKDLLADNTDWTNKLEAEQFIEEINYD